MRVLQVNECYTEMSYNFSTGKVSLSTRLESLQVFLDSDLSTRINVPSLSKLSSNPFAIGHRDDETCLKLHIGLHIGYHEYLKAKVSDYR